MNPLLVHIVSGQAFFSGVVLVAFAAFASMRPQPIFRRFTALFFVIGVIAVVVSSTPLPWWCAALAGCTTLAWIATALVKRWRRPASLAMALAWLGAALVELPYHTTPALQPVSWRALTVIGDSVTAGVGGDEASITWPRLLARQQDVNVQDISHMGETAASAQTRASAQPIDSPVVVVEIGGNDLLGSTPPAKFAADLDALLRHLAAPGRQIVMFELPLPPFCQEYGRIQRRLAAKHNVALIPKRVLLSVIADDDATLDGIHLSQAGHQQMAAIVWSVIRSAFAPKPATASGH